MEAFSVRIAHASTRPRGRIVLSEQVQRLGAFYFVRQAEGMMTEHAFRVLVGFDETVQAEAALRLAFEQAGEHPLAQVHVVEVLPRSVPPVGLDAGTWWPLPPQNDLTEPRKRLQNRVAEVFKEWSRTRLSWIGRIVVHTRVDVPAEGILDLAENLDVDLIVVGTHGRTGITRLLFGSVAESVVRQATRPVLVAHANEDGGPPNIEPPCRDCLDARFATNGKQMWCTRHQEHHHFGRPVGRSSRPLQPHVSSL